MAMVVIGSTFVDIKGYPLDKFILNGRNSGRMETVHGGVARNIAEDIANLGLHPTFITLLDESGIASDVEAHLTACGTDMRYARRTADGMGTWLAVFDDKGDVAASISKRPDLLPIADILDEDGDAIFAGADGVLLELDAELPLVERIFSLAERHGVPVHALVSNMSIALERREFIPRTACFVCNQQEAGQLFAEDYETLSPDMIRPIIADKTARFGIPCMIVTLGAEGAVWACRDGSCGYCPAIPTEVVDTTGAGDSFFAGAAVGLCCGKSVGEACVIGSRLASAVISTTGNVCPVYSPAEFGLTV